MATPTIPNGEEYFFPIIYEGNGAGQKVGKFIPFTDNGTINKSCIFEDGDTPTLSRTIGSASSTTTFTISCWVKRGNTGLLRGIWSREGANDNNELRLYFDSSDRLNWSYYPNGDTAKLTTNRTFEDTSKWYHIVAVSDTGNSTSTYRWRLYVDGDEISSFATSTYPSQSTSIALFSSDSYSEYIGRARSVSTTSFDGYLAELNIVDGSALTPSTFGLTDTSTGRWIPKTLTGITYGNTGRRLTFANSAGQTIGDDTSGNTNDFTVNNLAATDITTDSPTNNFMTFTKNGQVGSNGLSEGNLKPNFPTGTGASAIPSTFRIPVGKWYFEYYIPGTNSVLIMMAVAPEDTSFSGRMHTLSGFKTIYPYTRTIYEGSSSLLDESNMPLAEDDTTVGVYIERKTDGTVNYWVGDDQASKGTFAYSYSGNPATGANPVGSKFRSDENLKLFTGSDGNGNYSSGVRGVFNFGQLKESPIDSGTALTDYTSTAGGFFRYQPVDGFKALSQDNLPESTKQGISDFVWIKNRDATDAHQIYDSNRGPQKDLNISTVQESTTTDGLQKFLKGGFAIEDDVSVNTSGESYVSWHWVCNGGTTSANTDGSGATLASTIQVNQTAGFSIIQHTGNGTNGATIEHGLSQAPTFLITKNTSTNNRDWMVWHHKLTDGSYFVDLNQNEAQIQSTSYTNSTAPSSTVITLGTSAIINGNGESYVTFAFHEVPGFSKFGQYIGNGSTNGTFVNTGFKPAWVLMKRINSTGNWYLKDTTRDVFNQCEKTLMPNLTNSEAAQTYIDIVSNGFKQRIGNDASNLSGSTYIYIAFAEHPFIGNGTNPVTAR